MKYMCHIIFLCLSCLNISCTKNYSETKMIVSSTDEGNQALQEFLMACNPKQQVFYNNYHRHRQHQHDHHQNHQHEHHHHQYDYHQCIIIILFLQHSTALESYLIKPIQRILKYPLLLTQLKVFLIKNVIMIMVRR